MPTKEYLALWRAKNPDKMKDYQKRWRQKYPEKFKEVKRNNEQIRRARLRASGYLSRKAWEMIKFEYDHECAICGLDEELTRSWTSMGLTIDHVIPVSKGGTNDLRNIQPLCMTCNNLKRDNIL